MVVANACLLAARHLRVPLMKKMRNIYPIKRYFVTHHSMKPAAVKPQIRGLWNCNKALLLRPVQPVIQIPTAQFGGVVRVAGSVLYRIASIRYLFLIGGTAGGVTAYQHVEEWKEKMSGFNDFVNKMKENVPSSEQLSLMGQKLSVLKDSVHVPDVSAYVEGGLLKLQNAEEWLKNAFATNQPQVEDIDIVQDVIRQSSANEISTKDTFSQTNDPNNEKEVVVKVPSAEELTEQLLAEQLEHQERVERLMEENKQLRQDLLLNREQVPKRKIKRTATDMYSQVLDELDRYNRGNKEQDHLPRVVVVGDQSAGKTSVLEMIAQARIFPRGSGEMMTRSPVKVTMCEGQHHVAKFNDSSREYNLKSEAELELLRNEIEARMRRSVREGATVSDETISLTVKGPGLRRIVLVDLPGVISTVTTGMAKDTRTKIREMCRSHMENPNAIILCIQDGSIDAERSNVTDLVSSMDPSGKRTIFVMTKVDVAENSKYSPDRIQKILEGKLFPMKALGYFAVVTGKGNTSDSIEDIKKYEEEFFQNSTLLRKGVLKSSQLTTDNLSLAVSRCFWKMVEESVHEQENLFRATGVNLQKEWEYKYPNFRKQDREELFAKAKREILNEVATISEMHEEHWDGTLKKELWKNISDNVFNIYLKAATKESPAEFNITSDVELREFVDKMFPKVCIEVGQSALQEEFKKLLSSPESQDPILAKLKEVVSDERHEWDRRRAEGSLRFFAMNTLNDKNMEKEEGSVRRFMHSVVQEKLDEAEKDLSKLQGPGQTEMWLKWRSRTPEENNRRRTIEELERLFSGKHTPVNLDKDQLTAMRKNLEIQSVNVDDAFIQDTWNRLHKVKLLKKTLTMTNSDQQGYFGLGSKKDEKSPDDLVFFWRIEKMLNETSKVLRKQLLNYEIQRFEMNMKNSLNKIGDDETKLTNVISGERVEIAEKLKSVTHIQELLSEFIEALKKEKA